MSSYQSLEVAGNTMAGGKRTKLVTLVRTFQEIKQVFQLAAKRMIFPIVPKTVESFITYLFWHSIFLTASTPVARMVRGRWMGVASVQTVITKAPFLHDIVRTSNATIYGDAQFLYNSEEESPGIDRAFGLHAFFGLLWVVAGFLQMVPVRRFSLYLHRMFGLVVVAVFLGHMLSALNNLVFDEARHHWAARAQLGSITLVSSAYMVLSLRAVRNGKISEHQDFAIRSFLYSIEGAGTIRQVAYMQSVASPYLPALLSGPGDCQRLFHGLATHCAREYLIRGLFTRLLTLYYIGVLTTFKKETNYAAVFLKEILVAIVCTLTFCSIDLVVTGLR